MFARKLILSLFIFSMALCHSNAQDYSSFDKARLIMDADAKTLDYYVKNNALFDSIAEANNITVGASFSYFRDISLASSLLKLSSPFARLSLMLSPAFNVPVDSFNVANIIKDKILKGAFPTDSLESITAATAPQALVVQLSQPVTDAETAQVAGVQATASGANFTTNLLQATAQLLLERGKQELANSFYAELSNKLDSIVALNTLFPNATQLLAHRDPFTLPSLGASWKGAFELDLQAFPENLIKFLEIKLPAEKDKFEVVLAFVKMLEDVKSGEHLYEAINAMYYNLPATNTFAQPVRLVSLISREMTMSRSLGDVNAGKVWASGTDFRNLGTGGQSVFLGFLLKRIESEGFKIDSITNENLSVVLNRVSNFLNALSKGEDAIAGVSADPSSVVYQFTQLSDAATEIFGDFKAIVEEISIIANSDGPEEHDNISDQINTLNDILNVIKRANQAVVAKEYGKLLPIALELFQLVDEKKYDEIQVQFKALRDSLVSDIKALKIASLKGLEDYLETESNFVYKDAQDLYDYIQGIKAKVNQLLDPKLKRKTAAMVYQLVSNELNKLKLDVPEDLMRIAMFVIDVTEAKTADEIQGVLDAAILPVGSYRMKREPYAKSVFLQGFAGFTGGYESLNNTGNQNYDGFHGGLFLPVGFEYTSANRNCGINNDGCGYNGIFLSVIDVGAIGSFNLSEDSQDLSIPALTFQNVLSPGLFYTHGVRNAPIVWGFGARFAPELRQISVDDGHAVADMNGTALSSVQFNVFLVVDIPLARIFKIKR